MSGARSLAARALAAAVALVAIGLPAVALSQGESAAQKAKKPATSAKAGTAAEQGPPKLAARAWVLTDPRDGAVLAGKAAGTPRPIASATKLMTAYVALKKLKPKAVLAAPAYKALAAESLLGLQAGEKLTVRDLLYGLILESGNDAAVTLATGTAGSVPAFVAKMNRQAKALGLEDSSFANPVGLDSPKNFSSAADLAALAAELLSDPLFAEAADSTTATLRSGNVQRRISTRNTLLGRDPSADGVKTGHTIGAGYVLVGSATRDGTQLISVVLGARSEAARDAETEKLLDYGFSLYRPSQPVAAGEELADPKLDYRDRRLSLVAERGIEVSARKGQPVETEVDAPEEVSGAIESGERLGTVTVSVDGRRAGRAPLVAGEPVAAASLVDKATFTIQNPFVLIPAGLIVIVVGLLLAAWRRHPADEPGAFGPAVNGGDPGPVLAAPEPKPRKRARASRKRTPEERRKMHEERMRRRRERSARKGDGQ